MSAEKANEPEVTEVCARPFHFTACGNDRFQRRKALLNTSWAAFFGFDWADCQANCLVCSRCGYIHWFLPSGK